MKRLMLVRHGESEWNADRRLQGQADIALSERGQAQARALRPTIAALRPDRVAASSLKRARHTAALLGFPDAELDDDLREIDVGDWAGRNINDLLARNAEAYKAWRAGRHTPPGGEAWGSFTARTGSVVRELLAGDSRKILVVSHGGVLRALVETLLALSPEKIVPVGPGTLTMLQHDPNGRTEFRLELFNFSPTGLLLDAPD
jgi:broad specificity phosphatase PhoE